MHIRLFDPPDRTTFFLPGEWAGHDDYARAIEIRGASAPDGELLYTIDRSSGRIDIKSDQAAWVQLDYDVRLDQRRGDFARFHPHFIDEVLFAYGPAFLLLPSEQIIRPMRDIPIEVHAPENWRLLSTWAHISSAPSTHHDQTQVHGYLAPTPGALRDAFLVAGRAIELQRLSPDSSKSDQSSITVGFDPQLELDQAQFSAKIEEILTYFRARFGDLGPAAVYIRQVPGDVSEQRGVGRRGGFVVELPATRPPTRAGAGSSHMRTMRAEGENTAGENTAGEEYRRETLNADIAMLLAHEAFHLWNGHYLTPSAEAELETRWFKEGVTHYMALKSLAELGLLRRDDVLAELNKAADYYTRNPATNAGLTPGANAADYARLPYDRGVLLGMALDAFLVKESHGQVELSDWINYLLKQLAAAGQDYRGEHLRAAFIEVCHQAQVSADGAAFWDALVADDKLLRPSDIFARAGLYWLRGAHSGHSRLLPIVRDDNLFYRLFPAFGPIAE